VSRRSPLVAAIAVVLAVAKPGAIDLPVHTVRVDAIAVDARGTAVDKLTPKDLELREDGNLVPIEGVEFVRNAPRLVAIYLDEYHISPGAGVARAREVIAQFVERELGPRDLLVVMKPLDSLFAIRLTSDRDAAQKVIATLEGRRDDLTPREGYERNSMVGSPQRIQTLRTQIAISALNALAVQLGTINNLRKTLIVVSERLDHAPRGRGQERLATVEGLVRSANRAHVSIYPIDPRSPSVEGDEPDPVLTQVARDTAGRTIGRAAGVDELSAAIRAVAAESSAYYMLTYRSAHEENGTFHPIVVRAKRAGMQLRARAGYWAPSADDRLRAEVVARANTPPVVVPLEPARRSSPLIRPWFGLAMGEDDRMKVTFVWEPTSVPGSRAATTAARLDLTVLGDGDAVVFQGPVLPAGPDAALSDGPSRAVFETAPGRLRLRMNIQDGDRRDVDTDVRDLIVRDLRGKVAIGTPEVMRARNAREFRILGANPDATPVSSRVFSRTERLLVRFPAYAPDGEPTVSARLLNRMGQTMRTLDVNAGSGGDHEVDLMLSSLASGEYQLQLDAKSPAGTDTERIDFRVTS
jgi:VWFA-related protein